MFKYLRFGRPCRPVFVTTVFVIMSLPPKYHDFPHDDDSISTRTAAVSLKYFVFALHLEIYRMTGHGLFTKWIVASRFKWMIKNLNEFSWSIHSKC